MPINLPTFIFQNLNIPQTPYPVQFDENARRRLVEAVSIFTATGTPGGVVDGANLVTDNRLVTVMTRDDVPSS